MPCTTLPQTLFSKKVDLHTSDRKASSDSPPNAFFSAASSYGVPFQGLQQEKQPKRKGKKKNPGVIIGWNLKVTEKELL